MLSNNHNSSCAFGEQIVSYIYDEASAKERDKFEKHLINCLSCADEIAGFGLVRSSINEWRKEEFLVLESPALKIPELQKANLVQSEKSSWLNELRNIFSYSPAWTAGFAALIVCVGLIWLVSGSSKENVASNSTQEITPVTPINVNQDKESIVPPKEEKAVVMPKEEDSKIAPQSVRTVEKKPVAPKQTPVRASNIAPKSVTPKINNAMAVNKNNRTNNIQRQKAPTLSEVDGDEDNSLRLSELFDEIDSK
ncbi:MAG TPA: zf-HC2 domain-containing protein [Pyrinomonadaceae bacterium]|nr:zf-HC2 domain-containing protein [Pyrinomonadaceae bacterium]